VSNSQKYLAAALIVFSLTFLVVPSSSAQQRMSDKDIENTMKNLKEDSKRFQSSFNSAISKSTIRKTQPGKGREKPGEIVSDPDADDARRFPAHQESGHHAAKRPEHSAAN
jgi:hypothetical protein